MLLIVGLVIVVYAKKDQKTRVIVISSEQLKKMNSSNYALHLQSHTKDSSNLSKNNPLLKSNLDLDIPAIIENEWIN